MALVNIKEMLEKARKEHYAVGAFDASTIEMAMAIVEAAEEEKSPVIVMGLTPDLQQGNEKMLTYWTESLKDLAKKASVPVCLHLDHARDMNFLKRCVDAGFTSVMYDASEYPFEENVRLSKEAADYAHKYGATVEAELGHVGDGIVSGVIKEDGNYDNPEDYLTNPEEMKRFIAETGVDCLAVAVGTSHGVYVHEPKLDFERLELLNSISDIPMVVHGGSGTPDDQIKKAISLGVTSFGNGVVFLDKEGYAIAPGCFSQDYRANSIIEMYQREGTYEKINDIVKGTLFAGEPGPILRWYKENYREIYDQIGGILQFKDYIMYRLTNVFATDLNCFGGAFMVDMNTMDYSRELMDLYGILELYDALPKLATEPTEIVGTVTKEASEITGLAEGTPVAAGMMDILACLVGAGATGEEVYTAVAGSWCINETHSDRIIPNASSNMPYLKKGEYLNCSYTGASGSNYEWFTRILGGTAKLEAQDRNLSQYAVLDELIEMVPIEKVKVFFSPFVAQPSIHMNAKANFFNIDMSTSYAEICYSVAEGVAFIHKHHIDFLRNAGLPVKEIRLTGGTAKSHVWNQIFANVLQVPIVGVDCEETGAQGVAIAAGIGAGVYKDYEDAFEKAVKVKEPVLPDDSTFPIYEKRYKEWCRLNEIMKTYWDEKSKG